MAHTVELIPISEGNRVTVKENEKIIAGRGSSLGCNDKKISRQHAELFLKKDETLWIKPTHTNPVFYRPLHGKTTHLTKEIEQELKDGDQIGLLPTSFFFRVSFSTDTNNNKDVPSKTTKSSDVEPKSDVQKTDASTSSVKNQDQSKSTDTNEKTRALPTWMSPSSSTNSTSNDRSNTKRQLSSDDHDKITNNESSTTSDKQSTKTSTAKGFDDSSDESFDSVSPKKLKTSDKPRPVCRFGASCYRKNPQHRTEHSHPDDSDYDDEKETKQDTKDSTDADKPPCPYGKTCYRQNPQHKRDYKH